LADGSGELAVQLSARDLADTRGPVASVHVLLAKMAAGWLLIFDNAADRAPVEVFLPSAGPGAGAGNEPERTAAAGQVVDVPVLSTDAAAEFLITRTGRRGSGRGPSRSASEPARLDR
jgi:hypothetical protein